MVIFWARIRGRSERLAAACLGIAISTAYQITHREAGAWGIALAYGVGSAAIVVAFARSWLGEADDTASRLRTALVTSLFPAKLYFGLILLTAAAAGTPQTFDTVLTAIDQSLAGNVSFSTGRLLEAHDIVHALVLIAYDAAPVMVMLAAAFRWRRFGARDATSLPLAAALAAASGVILYRLVPAAGPVYRWGPSFPSLLPLADLALVPSPVDIGAFRNAMPSLHFAGALFVAWGTWDLGWLRRLFGLGFLALTALATLGTGQHYLVDLVVAVPFALAVEASVRRPQDGWFFPVFHRRGTHVDARNTANPESAGDSGRGLGGLASHGVLSRHGGASSFPRVDQSSPSRSEQRRGIIGDAWLGTSTARRAITAEHWLFVAPLVPLLGVALALLLRITPARPWTIASFLSAPIILGSRAPDRRTWVQTLTAGVLGAFWYHAFHPGPAIWPASAAIGLGAASMIVACARIVGAAPDDERERFRTSLVVPLFPLYFYAGISALILAAQATPRTYDTVLTAVDQSFGETCRSSSGSSSTHTRRYAR